MMARDPVGVVVAPSTEYPHALAVAAADKAEPVVLDLERPLRANRHGARVGRQARLDEARRAAGRSGGTPKHRK
jgi:hypothetical protein